MFGGRSRRTLKRRGDWARLSRAPGVKQNLVPPLDGVYPELVEGLRTWLSKHSSDFRRFFTSDNKKRIY